MEPRIGFIGLGTMGRWMALNLVKAGYKITVFDRDRAAAARLTAKGAAAADSPAQAAGRSEWVFLCLPDTAVVEEVIFGPEGLCQGGRPGLVIVDCGTTGYLPTLEFHRRLGEKGIILADAPVSGMEARAREGDLTIMFGGEGELFQRLRPVLEVMGSKVLPMGGIGAGQLTKLVNQLLFNISCAAMAEVLPLAVKMGLDPEKVAQVVTSGTGRSFALEFFAPLALKGVFDQGYPLKAAYKDMISAAELSARERVPLPLVQAATITYQLALAQGLGSLSKGAMIQVYEKLLGVEFRKREG